VYVLSRINRRAYDEREAQLWGSIWSVRIAPKKQVVSLITLFDLIMLTIMFSPASTARLNWREPNRLPKFVFLIPYLHMGWLLLGRFTSALPSFWINGTYELWSCFIMIYYCWIIMHDKIIWLMLGPSSSEGPQKRDWPYVFSITWIITWGFSFGMKVFSYDKVKMYPEGDKNGRWSCSRRASVLMWWRRPSMMMTKKGQRLLSP
jgi:hypothetical protein